MPTSSLYGVEERTILSRGLGIGVTIDSKYVNMADINVTAINSRRPAEAPAGEPILGPDRALVLRLSGLRQRRRRGARQIRFWPRAPSGAPLCQPQSGHEGRGPAGASAHHQTIARPRPQTVGGPRLYRAAGRGAAIAASGSCTSRRKARALALQLARLQTERIAAALKELGPGAHEEARRFLAAMIDREDRAGVLAFIESADEARRRT